MTIAVRSEACRPLAEAVTERGADDTQGHRRAVVLLRKYATPSDLHGFSRMARSWATIVAIWGLNLVLIPEAPYARVILFLCSAAVIGIAMGGLESCAHEATHYTLFRTRRLNNSLQVLFAAPVLESVENYREFHVIHHRELGGTNDPAMRLYAETGVLHFPDGFRWVMFVRPLLGYHALRFLRETALMIWSHPVRGVHIAAFWLPVLAAAYCFELWWWLAAYVLFPLFFVLPVLLFWAEVLDHGRLNLLSPIKAARNHAGRLSLALYPHNEGYHLVHHLHPGIPGHRLADAHRELLSVPWFRRGAIPCRGVGETVRDIAQPEEPRAQAASNDSLAM